MHSDLSERDVDKFEKYIKDRNEEYIWTTIQNMVSNYCLCTAHSQHKAVHVPRAIQETSLKERHDTSMESIEKEKPLLFPSLNEVVSATSQKV